LEWLRRVGECGVKCWIKIEFPIPKNKTLAMTTNIKKWRKGFDYSKLEINDQRAIKAIFAKNAEKLKGICFHTRVLIDRLKNDLESLEFLLQQLDGYDPGAGSYFFEGVIDVKTFDLYQKYGIGPTNLFKDCVTSEQWKYVVKIGYVKEEDEDESEEDE